MEKFTFNEIREIQMAVSHERDDMERLIGVFGLLSPTGHDISERQWKLASIQMKLQKMLEETYGEMNYGEDNNDR